MILYLQIFQSLNHNELFFNFVFLLKKNKLYKSLFKYINILYQQKNGVAKMNVAKAAAIFIILIMVLSGVATFITLVM